MVKHMLEHLLQIATALGKTTWFISKLTKLDPPQPQVSSGGKDVTLHLPISFQLLFLFHGVGAPPLVNPGSATSLVLKTYTGRERLIRTRLIRSST